MTELPEGFTLLPGSGASYAAALRKARLVQVRGILTGAWPPGFQRALAGALKRSPESLLGALAAPECSGPLRAVQTGLAGSGPAREALAALLVQLGTLGEDLLFPWPLERLADLGERRLLVFGEPVSSFRIGPDGLDFKLADGRHAGLEELAAASGAEQPFHRISPEHPCLLSLYDANPLACQEGHPDKSGNEVDLGGRTVEDWIESLQDAFSLVRKALPGWWAESPAFLRRIIPVGFSSEMHLSASYREVLGVAYLSLHPDPLTMAEAVVHEAQHSKLNTLLWLDPLLENSEEPCNSPIRPDRRNLLGVLLAAHAFVPVSALHLKAREQGLLPPGSEETLARRSEEVLANNRHALGTLARKARPTPLGERILKGLGELDSAVRAAADEHKPE